MPKRPLTNDNVGTQKLNYLKSATKGVKKEDCPLVVSVTLASKKDAADLLGKGNRKKKMA